MKYFIYGYYGYNNFGDDLLLKTVIDEISKVDKNAFFYVKNNEKISLVKNYSNIKLTYLDKILYLKQNLFLKVLKYLKQSCDYIKKVDVFLIGPGGLFLDKGNFNKSLFLLCCLLLYAKIQKKKVIIFGISIDILASVSTLILTKIIFLLADFISARDRISFSYLKYIVPDKSILSADISFLNQDIKDLLHSHNKSNRISNNKKTIGLCFIDYFNTYEKNKEKDCLFKDRILNILYKHKDMYNYKYIIFQEGEGQKDDEIYKFINSKINIECILVNNIDSLKEINKNIDIIITMRYHLAIIGYMFKKEILIIDHETKMSSLAVDLNLKSIFIDDILNENMDFISFLSQKNIYNINLEGKARLNFKWIET
jgi:polysaccharide pyruvyl transferase WcaK-like protein